MTKNSSEIEVFDETAKAREAHSLHLMGIPWDDIATRVGYKTGESARLTVRKTLQRAALDLSSEKLEEMLDTEFQRLDVLQAALWPMAISGDTRSIDTLLRLKIGRAHV